MEIKFKKLTPDAVIPTKAHVTDAGFDLTAVNYEFKADIDCHVYGTGIALEIPFGYVGLIFPRSSNRKTDSYLANHVGVCDSGYRGEVFLSFKNRDCCEGNAPYKVGDKVGQLIIIPYPEIEFTEVETLNDSDRGTNGHGSTGN